MCSKSYCFRFVLQNRGKYRRFHLLHIHAREETVDGNRVGEDEEKKRNQGAFMGEKEEKGEGRGGTDGDMKWKADNVGENTRKCNKQIKTHQFLVKLTHQFIFP